MATLSSPSPSSQISLRTDIGRATRIGAFGSLLLLAILIAWAQMTMINGAVIAQGQVVVLGKPKVVQSLDGGIVERINVKNGDVVSAGDLLMRLDPTLSQIKLDIARSRFADTIALKARLEAEQVGLIAPDFTYPPLPFTLPSTARQEEGQRQIFSARREVMRGRRDQLAEKILQFRNQIDGVEGQIAAKKAQLGYIETDLENMSELNAKGLARQSQVLELQGNQSELLGQISALQAQMAGILNSIRDAELETLQGERQFKEQVVTDLREVATASEELTLEIVTTQKQLERVDIRAPSEGVVHEMQVTTAGGVVSPGGTIVQIVPLFEGVAFEVRLVPQSIDAVHVGQSAEAVFPAFDQRSTPRLAARVANISPTSIEDPVTRQSYFRVELQITTEELARLNGQRLVPGMPVEAFLETGERSVLNYITRPLVEQLRRAFREK